MQCGPASGHATLSMPAVTFDVPEGALSALRLSLTEFVEAMRLAAAVLWHSQGEISQSNGAEIAGLTRVEFIDELARKRIAVAQATPEELWNEIHRQMRCETHHASPGGIVRSLIFARPKKAAASIWTTKTLSPAAAMTSGGS